MRIKIRCSPSLEGPIWCLHDVCFHLRFSLLLPTILSEKILLTRASRIQQVQSLPDQAGQGSVEGGSGLTQRGRCAVWWRFQQSSLNSGAPANCWACHLGLQSAISVQALCECKHYSLNTDSDRAGSERL